MTAKQNKKLTLGILLTFVICIGSAILAAYSTGPYGNYPNPGIHPGMIGPGTFNASGVANPQWNIPGGLVIGNPAGGSMGTGTINAEEFYKNGILFNGSGGGGTGNLNCVVRTGHIFASCELGETLTGGGCDSSGIWWDDYPINNTTWKCDSNTGSRTAYVVCCNITGGGGTYTEEKYCKRTSIKYNGSLGGIAGADAKCVAEFGAGWSFVDTLEEYHRIVRVDPASYNSVFGLLTSFDGMNLDYAWLFIDNLNCDNWINSTSSVSGRILRPYEPADNNPEWYGSINICSALNSIWCCPS